MASCYHEAPYQKEILVRSSRNSVLLQYLILTRSPGAIADLLRPSAYHTRAQGPGRFCSTVQSLTRPSFDTYGPSNVTTPTVMSRDGFSGPAGCQLSPSSHPGRK